MTDNGAPKSSFELAMERFRKQDAEDGVTTRRLTDEEKAAIAEVRSLYDSKIAEQEILQQSAMKNLFGADPEQVDEVRRRFRRERERLASERNAKVERTLSRVVAGRRSVPALRGPVLATALRWRGRRFRSVRKACRIWRR